MRADTCLTYSVKSACSVTDNVQFNAEASPSRVVSLERSLLSELEGLPDGIPNSLAASSRHEKPSSTEGFLSLDDKVIRGYE